MKYIIDRIENNLVICENQDNGKMEEFNIDQFPENIKEGDCLNFIENKFEIDEDETKSRKEKIDELMKKLMKG